MILGNPVCGLRSTACQVSDKVAGGGEGRKSGLRKLWGHTAW